MKKLIIALLFITNYAKAQTLQFQPLETNILQDDYLSAPPIFNKNYTELNYITSRAFSLKEYLQNVQNMVSNDSIIYDVYKLNILNNNKKHFTSKKNQVDSTLTISYNYYLHIDSINKNLYFFSIKLSDSTLTNFGYVNNLNTYINVLDSNLNQVVLKKINSNVNHPYPIYSNALYESDSTFISTFVAFYPSFHSSLYKYDFKNNVYIDSFAFPLTSVSSFETIYSLNDSTFISLTDSSIVFLNKDFQFISQKYLQTTFMPNLVPGPWERNVFTPLDSSFNFISKQDYPIVTPERNQLENIKGSNGTRNVLLKINHDSAFNFLSHKNIVVSIKNTDFISPAYKYCVSDLGYWFDSLSAITVMSFNENNQLRWKKYVGFDANYTNAMVLATPDSGCLVLVNRKDIINQQARYDLYYIKLDKYGNQITNYLPVSTSEIEFLPKNNISIYPNPFTNQLVVKSSTNEPIVVKFLNTNGQLVTEQTNYTNQPIQLSSLKTGLYFYLIYNAQTQKLIKSGLVEKSN